MRKILQETLKSLCHRNGWCYAVFWKLKRRSRMILTWEDGYYDFARPASASNGSCIKSLFHEFETGGSSLDHEVFGQEFCSKEDRISLAVAKMSYQVYSLGEGIIGHVAFTGKHQWLIREKTYTDKSNSICMLTNRMLEYADGWQNQFEYGIKTIAVVAVVPHGVVQLGSMRTIMEDLEFISHIRTVFEKLQNIPETFLIDCLQEPINGNIPGSIFPSLSLQLKSAGNPYQIQTSAIHSFQGQLNESTLKTKMENGMDQFGGPCIKSGKSKNIEAKPRTLPSKSISTLTTEISSRHSFQQQCENTNSFTHAVTIGHGTKMGGTMMLPMGTRKISPFHGTVGVSQSLADNQYALLAGLGTRNNSVGLIEEHVQREIGLQGLFQLPCTSTAVQSESDNSMLVAMHETSSLPCTSTAVQSESDNSMLVAMHETLGLDCNTGQVESNQNRELSNIVGEELIGEEMFVAGSSNLDVLQQKNMLPPASTLQYAAGQSESSTSLWQFTYTNQSTGVSKFPVPKVEINVNNVYKYPMVSSGCIQTCEFDSGQPLCSLTTGLLGNGTVEFFNNGLLDGLLMSKPVRREQQPCVEKIRQKSVAGHLEDSVAEKLDSAEESSKDLEFCIQNLLAVRDDHHGHGGDAFNDYKNVLQSLIRGQDNMSNAVSNPSETDKAFQTLESALRKDTNRNVFVESLLSRRNKSALNVFPQSFGILASSNCHSDVTQSISPHMHKDMEGDLLYKTNSEHLLDAVVGNLYSNRNHSSDDNVCSKSSSSVLSTTGPLCSPSVRTDTCSAGQMVCGLEQTQSIFADRSQCIVDKGNLQNLSYNFDNPNPVNQGHTVVDKLIDESPSTTHVNSWIDDGQSSKCENSVIRQTKESAIMVKVSRKRARPGESGRPRPKDRQQIQDRVRELREIIPKGSKCSIDSLLERTIKHMIFLQSVTKHAENLKQSFDKKALDKDGIILPRDNVEGGASWALELSGQTMGCPVIVENLNQPGQMLVEMLCEDQGLFLEIAVSIRGLGLTILKGIMEARNGKIWAHFIVEANRDVHRVEILCSLVHLVQPNSKNRPNTHI